MCSYNIQLLQSRIDIHGLPKVRMSMTSCSGLQTLFAIHGSVAVSVGPITAPPTVNGLCCPSASAAMLVF